MPTCLPPNYQITYFRGNCSANITVGQYIRSDSDPVAIVADLQKIWVIASVKENDLGAVSLQDQVEIFTESMHGKTVRGLV